MKLFLLTVIAITGYYSYSQNQGYNWVFGDSAGLNFETAEPMSFYSTVSSLEACASVSDAMGSLLFYTNGQKAWNKSNEVMPNGSDLEIGQLYFSGSSITQGAIILPDPGNNLLFYIFQLQNKGIKYSVVDMNLDGGLGDITQCNISLYDEYLTEKMQAVRHGNGRDWWLILIDWPDTSYYGTVIEGGQFNFIKFLITSNEIQGPFVQSYGAVYSEADSYWGGGQFKISPQGNKLLDPRGKHIDLYDFDRCTGEITNKNTVENVSNFTLYGAEFSPDGNKIYVNNWEYTNQNILLQYCLNCDDEIYLTRKIIYQNETEGNKISQLLLAPDNKIYLLIINFFAYGVKVFENTHLSVINFPNEEGLASDLDTFTISLLYGKETLGLPNMPNYNLGPLIGSECDTLGTGVNTHVNTGPVSIFPNPGEGIIYFNSGFNFTGNLMVYNLMGELMYVAYNINQSSQIDLTKLRKGIYFLKLIGMDESEQIFKIVIQ